MNAKVARGSDQFMLRLPDGMRDRIKAAADQSGRSMNAEIVHALELYLPSLTTPERNIPDYQEVITMAFPGGNEMADEILAILKKHVLNKIK